MTVKPPRRPQASAVAAFSQQVDERHTSPPADARPTEQAARREPAGEWPAGIPRSNLIRYPDPELPRQIDEVAALLDRTKHATMIRALRAGLEVLRSNATEPR